MVPIYDFECDKCISSTEKIQAIGTEVPICSKCGGAMRYKFSPIAILNIKWDGVRPRTKGYKEGYKKEYLKSKGQEAWRDTIVSLKHSES